MPMFENEATDEQINGMTVFQNDQFGKVRVVNKDDEAWFVSTDVCRALDIQNSRDALSRLDEDEKGVASTDTLGGMQKIGVVNESGLYTLALGSRKPEAKAFKRWVTHEVMPAIRRNGAYLTPTTLKRVLTDPNAVIQLLTALTKEQEKSKILQPKADYFDALVERNTLTGIRETAKEYGVGQKSLVDFLIGNGYVYRDQKNKLQPYAAYVEEGLFTLKECKSDKNGWSGTQLLITPKGRETFRLLITTAS